MAINLFPLRQVCIFGDDRPDYRLEMDQAPEKQLILNLINKILPFMALQNIFKTIMAAAAILLAPVLNSQSAEPPFLRYMNHPWVDSVLKSLTADQKIAQCIWIAAYSNREVSHEVETADQIRKYGVGGLVFFQGTPLKQAELTNFYQKISKVPLLIAMDAEWGLGMRLTGVEKFPYQMTLGAVQNDSLIYSMGRAVAMQCRRLGVHVNLAPVADINNNPMNPVINYRSFGEDRHRVTEKTDMYMKGMQDNGILATLKHFPGHGDTNTDSHLDLPLITHPRERLDSVELFPFRNLIIRGAGSVMTAHLNLPSLDTTSNLPSTLSPVIINGLLRSELGFNGLVITDAMNMKGVTKYFGPGEAEAQAIFAGNDVVEFVPDVEAAINAVRKLIETKKIKAEDIELKCRKILAVKYWAGLSGSGQVATTNIDGEINSPSTSALIRELYSNSLTLLKNDDNIIPVRFKENLRIAIVSLNRSSASPFVERLIKYHPADTFSLPNPSDNVSAQKLLQDIAGYDIVITGVFGIDQRPNLNFGLKKGLPEFLGNLTAKSRTIVCWFGNPYGIARVEGLTFAPGLICTYQENEITADLAAQLIYGGIGAKGSLPVTINKIWPAGTGLITEGNFRLSYGLPENVGLSSALLEQKIDSIAFSGIRARAYPGCEIMVARKGMVVFHKVYGFHTYENRVAVREDDLFDLASVTKVSSTLGGLMLLDSEGKFSPEKHLGDYLPYFRRSNKGGLFMKDLLTHQAGLTAWIPFWKETVKQDSSFKNGIFRSEAANRFPLKVADHLYINRNYGKKIFREIKKSPLGEKKYVYSDLTFIISPGIIENLTGMKWYDYVTKNIYHRIGAFDIGFNPIERYSLSRIVPTEYDSLFRRQLLHGTVHDEGAAMLGGISGHAGLFSTADDLMKLMELYRRFGEYGGEQIIRREVFERYTAVQFPENNNRRALGFDKPFLNNAALSQKESYPTRGASPRSFGHSGYTGTFVWIDPVYDISYIFLSNRVYPTRNNNLLSELNIRTNVLQSIYDSITP